MGIRLQEDTKQGTLAVLGQTTMDNEQLPLPSGIAPNTNTGVGIGTSEPLVAQQQEVTFVTRMLEMSANVLLSAYSSV